MKIEEESSPEYQAKMAKKQAEIKKAEEQAKAKASRA